MIRKRRVLVPLGLCGLAAAVFAFAAASTSAGAQTKVQLRAQLVKTTAKLAAMAWNSSCSADIKAICHAVKLGTGRVYSCLDRNKARLTEGCIKTLPKAKPLVAQIAQIRSKLAPAKRPNFLLIVADDLGWTDIASFGSEIKTPSIDALAAEGLTLTNFYVSVSCSPTRSMLLTGTDNHIAGLGTMAEMLTDELRNKPGYEGHLNDRVVTLAEVLRDGGYHTYMAGKWHLGEEPEHFPAARGFEKSLSMLYGAASYYSDMGGVMAVLRETAKYVKDGKELKSLPKDFCATRSYADTLVGMIREDRGDGKPFLAYLAFTSPHDPLHVPEPWLSLYKGQYKGGYAALKDRRAEGAKCGRVGLQVRPLLIR